MDYSKQTVTYKTVDSLHIKLDLYLPESSTTISTRTPILIWFPGGGLLMGRRSLVKPNTHSILKHGYALVSPDYRFAPQT
jgi:acetyl esterase/lipase